MWLLLWVGVLSNVTGGAALLGRYFGWWDASAAIHTLGALVATFGFTALARSSSSRTTVKGLLALGFGLVVCAADPFSLVSAALWLAMTWVMTLIIADRMEDLVRTERLFYPRTLVFSALGGSVALTLLAPHWQEYGTAHFIVAAVAGVALLLTALVFSKKLGS